MSRTARLPGVRSGRWQAVAAGVLVLGIGVLAVTRPGPDDRRGMDAVAETGDPAMDDFVFGPSTTPPGSVVSDPRPGVDWVDDGRYLAVTAYGSSSCPSGPKSLGVDGQELTVRIFRLYPGRDTCTADLAAHTTVVEVPDGLDPSRPVTVLIGDDELVLPPAT